MYSETNYFSIAMFIMHHNAICAMACLICTYMTSCSAVLWRSFASNFVLEGLPTRVEINILLHVGGMKANNLSGWTILVVIYFG